MGDKMVRYSVEDKRELLKILNEERSEGRCRIIKGLMDEATTLVTVENAQIAEYKKQIEELKAKCYKVQEAREKKLKAAKLFHFDLVRGNCTIHDIHPTLQTYDIETREKEKEIRLLPVR
jgi:hypothetical protein